MDFYLEILEGGIIKESPFQTVMVEQQGMKQTPKFMKLTSQGVWASFLNLISPASKPWNGHIASCYKEHILAVNGFEEMMQCGGQDCEFGDRLLHLGLKPKRIRYSTICVHLDHKRGYVTPEMLANSRAIRDDTKKHKRIKARLGLSQYL